MSSNYLEFLDNKTMFYDKIDYSIIKKSWDILSKHINIPYVIHIVGTNGKGSTGRFVASFLYQNKKNVLHYSSPHIIKFNERIWINNQDSSDELLQQAHEKLQKILPNNYLVKLTYFEYTTLMAFILSDDLDFLVLEAGLGGEFDATNVVKNDLSVIPSIGLDHIEFLGDTIEKIATTKLKSCDNSFILGINMLDETIIVKNKILKNKQEVFINKDITLPQNSNKLPNYLINNLKLALSVIEYLNLKIDNLIIPSIFGRCQKITNNITIDVGHNVLAANVIYEEFKDKKINLIYNTYKDKDYQKVLKVLKPIINEIQIIKIDDNRILNIDLLINTIKKLNIKYKIYDNIIDKNKEYLVFGSFKVVEKFLEQKDIKLKID
jgi:dihydrofolate synthase/folylpolyglutamate synthase